MFWQVGGQEILVHLLTPEWRQQIREEVKLCQANTGALFNKVSYSLLGEDFNIPTMSFDLEGEVGHFDWAKSPGGHCWDC